MIDEKQTTKLSKFLSLVLRHQPQTIRIELDESGWVSVEKLISAMNTHGHKIDLQTLKHVVETNNKKRFAFSDDMQMIRANQGHSVKVNLELEPVEPPNTLYHGTATRFIERIFKDGLKKQNRHHVHLSKDLETASKVGVRHGKLSILEVFSGDMHKDGYQFFVSENGVWLTEEVPVKYLMKREEI